MTAGKPMDVPHVPIGGPRDMPRFGLGVYQVPPGEGTFRAVREALRLGYRLLDTARAYRNEADVGRAVRESGVPRPELFVTTKLPNSDQGYEATLRSFAESERALGPEPVDLYLIHWPLPGRRLDSWRALARLHEEGRCVNIGVSNFTVRHLEELEAEGLPKPAVDQVELHPFLSQGELRHYSLRRGIQLEAYSPLVRAERMGHPVLHAIAAAHGATVAQVLLRWSLQSGFVTIPKSIRPERLRENLGALSMELTAADMERLDALDEGLHTSWDPTDVR